MDFEMIDFNNCEQIAEIICEYIDGELDDKTAALVRRHIDGCADCKKLYLELLSVCEAAAASAYDVPMELHDRVMKSVRAEQRTVQKLRVRKKIISFAGIGVAAMLCICVGVTSLISRMLRGNDVTIGTDIITDGVLSNQVSNENTFAFYSVSGTMENASEIYDKNECVTAPESQTADKGLSESIIEAEKDDAGGSMSDSALSTELVSVPCATEAEYTQAMPETTSIACTTMPTPTPVDSSPNEAIDITTDRFSITGKWSMNDTTGQSALLTINDDGTFSYFSGRLSSITGTYTLQDFTLSFSWNDTVSVYELSFSLDSFELAYVSGSRLFE